MGVEAASVFVLVCNEYTRYDSFVCLCIQEVHSLVYAFGCARPELSQVVGMVCKHMHDPCEGYWVLVS
jgi:hypothetical protein